MTSRRRVAARRVGSKRRFDATRRRRTRVEERCATVTLARAKVHASRELARGSILTTSLASRFDRSMRCVSGRRAPRSTVTLRISRHLRSLVASRASNALGDRIAHGSREFSGVDVPPSRPAARVRGARSIERHAISERATIDLFASSCRVSSRARSTRRPRDRRARRAWWTSIGFASTDGARARARARGR